MSAPHLPQAAKPLLRAAITVAVLATLWFQLDGEAALARLAGADLGWLVVALVIINVQTVISAMRWRLTASRLGQRFGAGRAVAEYYLSQLVNQTLPGGMIGDAGRAVRARHDAGLAAAAQAVVLERMSGQVTLFVIMLGAILATLGVPGGVEWPGGTLATLAAALGLAALVGLAFVVIARLPGRWGGWVRSFAASARTAVLARDVWPSQLALSIGTVACNLAAFAACAQATGTTLPLLAVLSVVPLVLATMLIPISVGGWGPREGAAAALWPLAGGMAEAGLAASIAFGLVLLASGLPGLVPLILEMRRPDAAPESEPSALADGTSGVNISGQS